jgi:hypothetical protein
MPYPGFRDPAKVFNEPERRIELELAFGDRLDFFAETFEGLFQFVSEFSFSLK